MSKHFKTWFGVPIPPFKEDKLGAGSITIRFVITGKIPSKKNNQMSVAVRKYARLWLKSKTVVGRKEAEIAISKCTSKVRANIAYKEWSEKTIPMLQKQSAWWVTQLKEKGLIFPLQKSTMSLRLYFKHRYVSDTVNKQQSINDILVDAGIIANDDYNTLNPVHSASACYYEEIIQDIALITLSFRL